MRIWKFKQQQQQQQQGLYLKNELQNLRLTWIQFQKFSFAKF